MGGSVAYQEQNTNFLCYHMLKKKKPDKRCPIPGSCPYPFQLSVQEARTMYIELVGDAAPATIPQTRKELAIKLLDLTLYKTKLCLDYVMHKPCTTAKQCELVHVRGPDADMLLSTANSQRLCPWLTCFTTCIFGSQCRFKHPASKPPATTANQISLNVGKPNSKDSLLISNANEPGTPAASQAGPAVQGSLMDLDF